MVKIILMLSEEFIKIYIYIYLWQIKDRSTTAFVKIPFGCGQK